MEETFARVAWPQYNQMNREAYLEIGERFITFSLTFHSLTDIFRYKFMFVLIGVNRDNPAVVKNYYRNAHVGFWSGLVPQLHAAGKEGVTVPEVSIDFLLREKWIQREERSTFRSITSYPITSRQIRSMVTFVPLEVDRIFPFLLLQCLPLLLLWSNHLHVSTLLPLTRMEWIACRLITPYSSIALLILRSISIFLHHCLFILLYDAFSNCGCWMWTTRTQYLRILWNVQNGMILEELWSV